MKKLNPRKLDRLLGEVVKGSGGGDKWDLIKCDERKEFLCGCGYSSDPRAILRPIPRTETSEKQF